MTPKYFFDYLCGLGFATQRAVPVRTSRPVYQNRNSFQQKGTEFFGEATEYTVKIPEVVRDAIRGSGSQQEIYVLKDNKETILLNKVGEFFSLLYDIFSGVAGVSNRSAGGIPLRGGLGRDPIKDYADHPDSESVDIELLLYASQNFLKGYYNNPLHLAMTLNLAKDILAIAKEEEEKKKREVAEELKKVGEDIADLMEDLGNKNKKSDSKNNEKDKFPKSFDNGVYIVDPGNFGKRTVIIWEFSIPDGLKFTDTTFTHEIANHSRHYLLENKDSVFFYRQNDTTSIIESYRTIDGERFIRTKSYINKNELSPRKK